MLGIHSLHAKKSWTIRLQAKVFGILVRLDLVFPRPILVEKNVRSTGFISIATVPLRQYT